MTNVFTKCPYRFGPLQEREQKRQLSSSTDTTLAWVYTLVGADGKQLATYNGLQGALCGRDGVRLWPVEFNTYGPNNTRIITRADGTSEVVISDYLGSARVTLSTSAEPLQSSSYHPYGTERTSTGSGARTSYIGREHDNETDLGFYGVRLYEPEYGRFLSTDVLWAKYLPLQPYQYCRSNPIQRTDRTGMADFFDENGQKVGSDGVNDGAKYIANAAIYSAALGDQTSWEMMGSMQGVYQLPSAGALNAIETSCLKPALNPVGDQSRREYGGVIGSGGDFFEAAPGPIATGVSQQPEIELTGAYGKARDAGQSVVATVHTHVNFAIKGDGSQRQGNVFPSEDDRAKLGPTMYPYGMVIWPTNVGKSLVTFYGQKTANDKGVKTDVRIGWGVLKGIVEDSGSKK